MDCSNHWLWRKRGEKDRGATIPDTLRSIVRTMDDFKQVKGIPIENERYLCNLDSIDDYFDLVALALSSATRLSSNRRLTQ